MAATSSRFFPRAPRYTLRSNDENQMRFALMQTRGSALETELVDVSKSGLKFSIFNTEVPKRGLDEGDVIKIEFKIPSGRQIACFATVTRLEQIDHWDPEFGDQSITEVAVQFRHLPDAFASALEKSMPKQEAQDQPASPIHIPIIPSHMTTKQVMLFSLSSIALCSLFMFLSISPTQWMHWFSR